MKLAILDPGFGHPHAHHLSVNLEIFDAFRARNSSVEVYASCALEPVVVERTKAEGLIVKPWFETPGYPDKPTEISVSLHNEFAQSFSCEIVRLYDEILNGDENLLFHTGFSFHVLGLARALWNLGNRFSGKLVVSLMFAPGAGILKASGSELQVFDANEYLRYRLALGFLRTVSSSLGGRVELATSCRSYRSIYQTLWPGRSISIQPGLGSLRSERVEKPQTTVRPRILLYVGGVKEDKGIEFSARLGIQAARALPDTEFVFQFNQDFPSEIDFSETQHKLRQAADEYPNFQVVWGYLDAERYADLLRSVDVLCILYDPASYRFKTSGVLWDGLHCRRLRWLVTQSTWMEEELTELGLPHSTVSYNDLQQGLDRLRELIEPTDTNGESSTLRKDERYHRLLCNSFGIWLHELLGFQYGLAAEGEATD